MEQKNQDILSEISSLMRTIETDYPELQKYLKESRSTIPAGNSKENIDLEDLKDYRNTLRDLITKYDKKD